MWNVHSVREEDSMSMRRIMGCLHGEHFHGERMQVIWATIPGRWCLLGDEGNEPAGVGRSYDQPRHRGGPGPDSRFQHFQCKNPTSICRPCKHARCTRDLCAWTHWWWTFRKKRDLLCGESPIFMWIFQWIFDFNEWTLQESTFY